MRKPNSLMLMVVAPVLACAAGLAQATALPGGLRVLPADASVVNISGTTTINGISSRMMGFESRSSPTTIAALYVREWGQPIVKNQLGSATVLGKAVGKSFVTVRLQATARGTQGIISVTDAPSSLKVQQEDQRELKAWLNQLGGGARVVHHSRSTDIGQQSTSLLFSARLPERELARRASQFLNHQGFLHERDFQDDPPGQRPPQGTKGLVRLFKAPQGGEALITVFRHSDGQAYVKVDKISIE